MYARQLFFLFLLVFLRYVMCTEGMQIPNFIILILFGKSYAFFRKNNTQIKYVCYCSKTRNLPLFKASILFYMYVLFLKFSFCAKVFWFENDKFYFKLSIQKVLKRNQT